MQIRSLRETFLEVVHMAFTEAFSDYEVQIQVPFEKFLDMVKIRSLKLEYSIGCFDGERLVSFIICGYRTAGGKNYCYDGGTGTVREFRRKGIGSDLLRRLIEELKLKNIESFILEVLENNFAAIELYKKHGFITTRRLECYELKRPELKPGPDHDLIVDKDACRYKNIEYEKFDLYEPSWQNAYASIGNAIERYAFISLLKNGQAVGYGFINKAGGDIPQIGIHEGWRESGLEAVLIRELLKETASERVTVLNVAENNYLGIKLKELGFKNFINQIEMKLVLK